MKIIVEYVSDTEFDIEFDQEVMDAMEVTRLLETAALHMRAILMSEGWHDGHLTGTVKLQ